jgi:hypothetical protein
MLGLLVYKQCRPVQSPRWLVFASWGRTWHFMVYVCTCWMSPSTIWCCSGLKTNLQVVCWGVINQGAPSQAAAPSPSGTFRQISIANAIACGVTSAGLISCWINGPATPLPTNLQFVSVSAFNSGDVCGLIANGTAVCAESVAPTTFYAQPSAPQFYYQIGAFSPKPCPLGRYSVGRGSISPVCSGVLCLFPINFR